MLHPSYSELMTNLNRDTEGDNKISSRYTIVIAAAKRARQLTEEAYNGGLPADKAVSTAVQELYEGRVKIVVPETDENDASIDSAMIDLYGDEE